MQDDNRCCGTGTCIIDAQGLCWCGQQWDGEKMCRRPLDAVVSAAADAPPPPIPLPGRTVRPNPGD